MAKTIQFKSNMENWRKEYLGLKRNTIRLFDMAKKEDAQDVRREVLQDYLGGDLNILFIEIQNTHTKEVFRREVTDVTYYEGLYIISW